MNLTEKFQKFAGREVFFEVEERKLKRQGKKRSIKLLKPVGNDKLLTEMQNLAATEGATLRVWWPDVLGTSELRANRINVYIEQGKDGKYRVANRFNMG